MVTLMPCGVTTTTRSRSSRPLGGGPRGLGEGAGDGVGHGGGEGVAHPAIVRHQGTRSTLPTCSPASSTRWPSAASASGRTRSTTGPHRAPGHQRPHLLDHRGADPGLLRPRPGPQRAAVQGRALGHERGHVELGAPAAHEPDDHEPAAGGEQPHVQVQVARAHRVEDDVDAAPAGQLHDPGVQVVGPVVEHGLGPVRRRGRDLGGGARRGQGAGPERAHQLGGHGADAARGAVDEERLARRAGPPCRRRCCGPSRPPRAARPPRRGRRRRAPAGPGRPGPRRARRTRRRPAARTRGRRPRSPRPPRRPRPRCPSTRGPATPACPAAGRSGPGAAAGRRG